MRTGAQGGKTQPPRHRRGPTSSPRRLPPPHTVFMTRKRAQRLAQNVPRVTAAATCTRQTAGGARRMFTQQSGHGSWVSHALEGQVRRRRRCEAQHTPAFCQAEGAGESKGAPLERFSRNHSGGSEPGRKVKGPLFRGGASRRQAHSQQPYAAALFPWCSRRHGCLPVVALDLLACVALSTVASGVFRVSLPLKHTPRALPCWRHLSRNHQAGAAR